MPLLATLGSHLIAGLADASVRSLLLALLAGASVLLAHSASLRHAVWSTVLTAMLLMPLLGLLLPPLPLPLLRPEITARFDLPLDTGDTQTAVSSSSPDAAGDSKAAASFSAPKATGDGELKPAAAPPVRPAAAPNAVSPSQEAQRIRINDPARLEQRLASNPQDMDARGNVISYYFVQGMPEHYVPHMLWLIHNHPESFYAAVHQMGSRQDAIPAVYWQSLRAAWLIQVMLHGSDPRVLANAAGVFERTEPAIAADLVKRVRLLDSENGELINRVPGVGFLYARAIYYALMKELLDVNTDNLRPRPDAAFARKVRSELGASNDASLLGATGASLVYFGSPDLPRSAVEERNRELKRQAREYGESLLRRAQALDPGNARWQTVLDDLRGSPVPKVRVPPGVQARMLVHSVPPKYPALARQSRIEGTVNLEVLIGTDGRVAQMRVIDGDPLLVPAAYRAVRQWVYRPRLMNDSPVEAVTQIQVRFKLER